MSQPVPDCAHVLPNGSHCHQPSLRGKLFCRHHLVTSRVPRRSLHQKAMDRLRSEARTLSTFALLGHLNNHLLHIQSALTGYVEARALLTVVLERINELERSGHRIDPEPVPSAIHPNLLQFQDLLQTMNCQ